MFHHHHRRATVAAVAATLLAMTTASHAQSSDPSADPRPRITVTAQGTAQAVPDMAVLQLSVVREAEESQAATEAASTAMSDVMEAMRSFDIADRDLQTANFYIRPLYDDPQRQPDGTGRSPQITGYAVTQTLTVRVRDLSILGDVLSRSVELGVNQDGNFQLTNSEPDTVLATARRDAIIRAQDKAQTLAEAAGVSVGTLLSITENSGMNRPIPMERMAMSADAASVPIAAGENEYTVDVTVEWAINQ